MIVYKCDICKDEIKSDSYLSLRVELHQKEGLYQPEVKCKEGHVCGKCMEKISIFVGSLKE